MINRGTATLQLLIGLFAAGAVTCAIGLWRTMHGQPVSTLEVFVFFGVAFAVTSRGWWKLMGAEFASERIRQDGDKLRHEAERVRLEAQRAALVVQPVAVTEPKAPDDDGDEWYSHTLRPFFTNGHRAGGFSHGLLHGTMFEREWEDLCRFYISEAGRHVLRLDPGSVGYVLNTPTWTHAQVMREIANRTLPHPMGLPFDVDTLTDDAGRRAARRAADGGVGGSPLPHAQ